MSTNAPLNPSYFTINLLIVDDDRHILKSLENNFSSPLFKITCIDSICDALSATRDQTREWHCWILDIDLGENRSGLEIMQASPHYTFVLVLSGLQSMKIAAEAMEQGALAVYDKDPDSLERLYDKTCRIAALGKLLGGKPTQYLPVYLLLTDSIITSVEEWADKAHLSLRQLQRITGMHPVDTPKASLSLYCSLYYRLFQGNSTESRKLPPGCTQTESDFFMKCLKYCAGRFN